MPTGLDHVLTTVALCERLTQELPALPGIEDAWKQRTLTRLEKIRSDLVAMQERFFLRSKLCYPFAARCEQEAKKLEGAFAALPGSGGSAEALQAASAILEALERAVKVLDERSNAQGMVIT
jgi:hypothetical protein